MRQRVFFAWALLGLVIVAAVVIWGRSHSADAGMDTPAITQEIAPVKLRGPIPAFSGTTIDGAAISQTALKGKPAAIDFFASNCGPCQEEAGAIAKLAAEYKGRVRFVGVDIDETSKTAGSSFVQKHGWRFPIIWDPGDSLVNTFKITGKPSMVLVDRHGRQVVLVQGEHMLGEYRAALNKLVSE